MDTILRKSDILDSIKDLPDEISLEALIDRFIFIEKVKEGIKSSEEGHLIPHEEVKGIIGKWSK